MSQRSSISDDEDLQAGTEEESYPLDGFTGKVVEEELCSKNHLLVISCTVCGYDNATSSMIVYLPPDNGHLKDAIDLVHSVCKRNCESTLWLCLRL
jgi:hypothetical protein